MPATCIDIMRHGEPEGGHRYRGSNIDDPLTETGWSQMRGSVPENPPWQYIVSSPLQRCLAFSKELAEDLQIDYHVDEHIRETGFGVWEGKTAAEIIAEDKEALNRFYQDPVNHRPEGAEPLTVFSSRVWLAYQSIAEQQEGKHVLIVAHAGVARAIVANILQMSLNDIYSRLSISYAGIIHSSVEAGQPPKLLIQSP